MASESPDARRERLLCMVAELMTGARESAKQMEGELPDEFTVHAVVTSLRRTRELVAVLGVAPALVVVDEMHESIRRQRGRAQAVQPDFVKLFSRATVQLPIVLEGVFAGNTDGVDPLLPMINALRTQRGADRLVKESLLGDRTGKDNGASGLRPEDRRALLEAAHTFEQGTRVWQEGHATDADLSQLVELIDALELQSQHASAKRLFSLAGGLLAAIADRAFVCGPSLRAAVREVHGEIIRWATQGEASLQQGGQNPIARKLEYFVTVAPTSHPRVVTLRGVLGIVETAHSDLHAADARAQEVEHPNPEHHATAQVASHEGHAERRTGDKRGSHSMKRELNEFQLMTLNHLERFGWELKFVRHRGTRIIPVVFDSDRATYGVLQDDGELNEKPDFEIRV